MNGEPSLDPGYFSVDSWRARVQRWLDDPAHSEVVL